MEFSKNFDHQAAEEKWYRHWLDQRYFESTPDHREPYTIVIPPPNVTGVLHMGHCLNNTIQDILVRRARMQGKNACWVPGTDHASIATEAKVVQMLREKGIPKASLSREEFLRYAWEWKEEYGGIILQQLKKLGCSLDWSRTSFTMDPDYYQSVIRVFNDLYNKGYIYRGKRMIHWDPKAKTALSDEEVIYKEVQSKLCFIRYAIENSKDSVTIATVRPETILGDTAVCVHPKDNRYTHLHGKFVFVPLINRRIPVITDEYVTMEFGTGALKVTPAHDPNDYQLGLKHGLEIVDALNEDGTMSEAARLYTGEDRFEVRKKIIKELEKKGYLEKIEDYASQVGFSERTDVVVEPRLSLQWWVDMKKISGPALEAVVQEEIKFYPAKFKNLYRHWMENIKDWCISRQLWWGHRIPAWYDAEGRFVVAENEEQAREIFKKQFTIDNAQLKQDEDCLDTWFSSWLWPFEVFKGYSRPGNADIKYYYPTNTLVTAPEIIFFWVARMIMAGYEYMGRKPFSEVYFTGIVRDRQGRKMSKQLGNSPDLLGLIDLYGADAVRFGILISSPAGNDLLWDDASNEQGRNFINKIWNALKLVRSWSERTPTEESGVGSQKSGVGSQKSGVRSREFEKNFAVSWFENRLQEVRAELEMQFREFRLSEALKTLYSLIWDDFCSWYLEWIKPARTADASGTEAPIDKATYDKTVEFFEQLMQLLHPFMPFITEEIYHLLRERKDDITVKAYSSLQTPDPSVLRQGKLLKDIITAVRDARNRNGIKPKEIIRLHIQTENTEKYRFIAEFLQKQINAGPLLFTASPVTGAVPVVVEMDKYYLESTIPQDNKKQKEELLKELAYLKGFLTAVNKKLSNQRFIENAKPEVINLEEKKRTDAENKIRIIEESLGTL